MKHSRLYKIKVRYGKNALESWGRKGGKSLMRNKVKRVETIKQKFGDDAFRVFGSNPVSIHSNRDLYNHRVKE